MDLMVTCFPLCFFAFKGFYRILGIILPLKNIMFNILRVEGVFILFLSLLSLFAFSNERKFDFSLPRILRYLCILCVCGVWVKITSANTSSVICEEKDSHHFMFMFISAYLNLYLSQSKLANVDVAVV